ncbi:MAG: hypothetical protein NZM25_08400 [Leptospiraceae bacterium]|nr:hypothetical protein [Leptospiraceae bacterium]MDW8306738.1 hypothetical protein [Leptospiraceae bacterium]
MERFQIPAQVEKVLYGLIGVGLLSLLLGFIFDPHRSWAALLVFTIFLLLLSLSGGFFAAVQLVSGAKWSVVIRRLSEATLAALPVVGLGLLAIFFGIHHLYEWSHADTVARDPLLQYKAGYLNVPFFIVRVIIYFLLWFFLGNYLRHLSLQQDTKGQDLPRSKLIATSAVYLIVFAYTLALASLDLIMSLEPHWFTTMFPVYVFSGLAYSGTSAMIILIITIQKYGGLKDVTEEHLHDMGKWLFVFTTFWAYIAFSQHMLIWYANLPEETYYLEQRLKGVWGYFTAFFWIFHFVVPFAILLQRDVKRNPRSLIKVAWLTLFMGFADVVWMVYGGLSLPGFPLGILELGVFAGTVGVFGLMVLKSFAKYPQVPIGDPYLEESRHFHQPI